MGKASTLKRERRTTSAPTLKRAELAVLSVGAGDTKMVFGPGDEDNAEKIITDMLRQGYGIFVETDAGLTRVKQFNRKRMTYVIEAPAAESVAVQTGRVCSDCGATLPEKTGPGRKPTRCDECKAKPKVKAPARRQLEVPVAGSRARAIGATAGG